MKKLFSILALLLAAFTVHAQPTPVAPATQTEVNAGTSTRKFVSPATLAGMGYGVSNAAPVAGIQPFVLWSSYVDLNTNSVFLTNSPTVAKSQLYSWWGAGNVLTNAVNAHIISNSTMTGLWGLYGSLGSSSVTHTNTLNSLNSGTWIVTAVGTNTFITTRFVTNACWRFQTFGDVTNFPNAGLSNGISIVGVSNGTVFQFTSRVGATNTATTKIADAP